METGYADISIDQLVVYEDNPRFIKAVNQIDEINKIVIDDERKKELVNLAESILIYGQNPLESIGVIYDEDKKKYITVEGNRRLAAIKIYRNPLLAEANKTTFNSFKALITKYSNGKLEMPDTLRCYIFQSLAQANYWITLKHTGKNNGAGIVPWSRVQSQRQAIAMGTASPDKSFMLVEWLTKTNHLTDIKINTYEDIANTTTLNRLLDDKYVLQKFCLSYISNEFSSTNERFSIQCIAKVIKDLNFKKLPVKKVYDANARKNYVDFVCTEVELDSNELNENTLISSEINNSFEGENNNNNNSDILDRFYDNHELEDINNQTPSAPNYSSRNRIVSAKVGKITGIQGKASQIYNEIRLINCSKQPIASALLIRAFFEVTTKTFLLAFGKKVKKSNLGDLIHDCREHIIGSGSEIQKKDANKFFINGTKEGKYNIYEIEELHNVIHDTDAVKDKTFFFAVWDTFRPFMQDLWNIINEKHKKS